MKKTILAAGMDGTRHSRIFAIALGLVEGDLAKRYAKEIAADDACKIEHHISEASFEAIKKFAESNKK